MMMLRPSAGFRLLGLTAVLGPPAAGQETDILSRATLTQRLGSTVDLRLAFTDESGASVVLGDYFQDRPVILLPLAYRCSMMCSQVLNALMRRVEELDFRAGAEFHIVLFSLDPRETSTLAHEKKINYLRRQPDPGNRSGWHFLTGPKESIEQLTREIGYGFAYDARTAQFAHPAAAAVLTKDGTVSSYLLGVDYATKELRMALLDAAQGAIGSLVDRIVLRCYAYDPARGSYGPAITRALRIGGAITIAGLAGMIFWLSRARSGRPSSPLSPLVSKP